MVLCLRTRHENFPSVGAALHLITDETRNLLEYLNKSKDVVLLENWKRFRISEIEARSPIGEAYKYFENSIRVQAEN